MASTLRRTCLVLALAAGAPAALADAELERLRAENASLKAQLQSLQQSCPAPTAAAAAAASAAPAPAAAAPVAAAAVPAAVPAPAPAVVTPPPGYKLVPLNAQVVNTDTMAPPYDHTGCSRGLFQRSTQAKWDVADNWDGLKRGQSMAEVEKLLGKEHFDAGGGERVQWQYGKCGSYSAGYVTFKNGAVQAWSNSTP